MISSRVLPVALGALALLFNHCGGDGRAPRAASQPVPVFIISIDTLRSDRLPVYGYAKGVTPAIDRFRKDAILFRAAFTHSPLTLPSHVSLMTGQLPYRHGVRDNMGYALGIEPLTLPAILKSHGYATGAAVSSAVLRRDTGIARGFDVYDDVMTVSEQQTINSWTRDGDVTRAQLTKWLDSPAGGERFAFLHLYEPHAPYAPPEPYASTFADPYDGEIAYADEITGRFLDELRARGLYDRALIVLMSDHGEGLGDHGELEHGVLLYREAIQVPLLVKLPNAERGGEEIATPAAIADIMPTILARAGFERPSGLDGVDLISAPVDPRRTIYSESYFQRLHYGWRELVSLIGERHHYIEASSAELFDYKADPGEREDIAEQQRRVVAARRTEAAAIKGAHSFEAPRVASPEDAAKLAALGYLGSGAVDANGPLPDPRDEIEALTLVGRGSACLQRGEYDEAIDAGRRLLAHNPDFVHGWGLIGAAYQRSGKRELALGALREQMKRSPGNAQVALTMATLFAELGRYDEAKAHASLALEAAPAFARELLANVAIAEGKLDVAEAEAKACLAIEPANVQALMLLASVRHEQERFAEELVLLERTRATMTTYRMPAARDFEFRYGEALLRLGRVRDAEESFRAETEAYPDNLRAWASLAIVVAGQGRTVEAGEVLNLAKKTNPGKAMSNLAKEALQVIQQGETARRTAR